ncbi:succinylglutamate desuccinylase [Enterovibrio sp. ZSDZ35]|uniref:Succinylglutamate desuccinylase n=1 Tax=Enterovibrio qingdaonensis TaxID=2899818 RepID=A0ABT5QII1_9GAMM|nr:succinylglutamate desuccinylase [Enterovibrio sp. ZSDZ35]MDD1780789.1 succinylglutamate desuccinylase [Enterovibrio sp. ZSDZ35]
MQKHLFESFLKHTLYPPKNFKPQSITLSNGILVNHKDIGVLEVSPSNANSHVVISSGIHGDETAPIELVDDLVNEILSERVTPRERVLFIIGHPDAIHAHTRFIEENLNRLFANENPERNKECLLANRLQAHVSAFFRSAKEGDGKWHFDLHSAIRDSKHYMFGVVPASTPATDIRPLVSFIQAAKMDAVMLSRTPSSTFSWWSAENFGALAATFEMGKVARLYENDMTEFDALKSAFVALLSGTPLPESDDKHPFLMYKVTRTITKTDASFSLTFSNDAANFTYFTSGEKLASENDVSYWAIEGGEAVVFPNANVAIGQRACLLVQPYTPDLSLPLFVNVDAEPGSVAAS